VPAPGFALAAIKGLSHLAPRPPVLKLRNEDFSRDPDAVAALTADPLIAGEIQPAMTVAALVRADERLREAFPQIGLPLLVRHGTADKATVCQGSEFFYEMAGSKDKTLKLYEGQYHDLLNDRQRSGEIASVEIAAVAARVCSGIGRRVVRSVLHSGTVASGGVTQECLGDGAADHDAGDGGQEAASHHAAHPHAATAAHATEGPLQSAWLPNFGACCKPCEGLRVVLGPHAWRSALGIRQPAGQLLQQHAPLLRTEPRKGFGMRLLDRLRRRGLQHVSILGEGALVRRHGGSTVRRSRRRCL